MSCDRCEMAVLGTLQKLTTDPVSVQRPNPAGRRMGAMLVELTSDELRIINNALNEVRNGIDLRGEFSTRMGCSLEEDKRIEGSLIEASAETGDRSGLRKDRRAAPN